MRRCLRQRLPSKSFVVQAPGQRYSGVQTRTTLGTLCSGPGLAVTLPAGPGLGARGRVRDLSAEFVTFRLRALLFLTTGRLPSERTPAWPGGTRLSCRARGCWHGGGPVARAPWLPVKKRVIMEMTTALYCAKHCIYRFISGRLYRFPNRYTKNRYIGIKTDIYRFSHRLRDFWAARYRIGIGSVFF